jgi:hypothetical protein
VARVTFLPDGMPRTVSPRAVAAAWLRFTRVVPPQFAVGTARHETNYKINEQDVEPDGHTTGGIFQLDVPTASPYFSIGDAAAAGMPEKDIYDLDGACAVFAALCERRLTRILDAADKFLAGAGWGPLDRSSPPPDVWAYLAIGHNLGMGTCLKSIASYGLDWADFKRRNGDGAAKPLNIAIDRGSGVYGDDVISGGPDWEEDFADPFAVDDAGNVITDSAGAPIVIPEPLLSAATQSKLRLGLLGLLALLLILYAMGQARPWKVLAA